MRYRVSLTKKQREIVLICLDYATAGEIDGGPLGDYESKAAENRNIRACAQALRAVRDAPIE